MSHQDPNDIDETTLSGLAKPRLYLSLIEALKRQGYIEHEDVPRLIQLAFDTLIEGYQEMDDWVLRNINDEDSGPTSQLVYNEKTDEWVLPEEID